MKKIIATIAIVLTVGFLGAQAAEAHWGNHGPVHRGYKSSISKLYSMRISPRMDFFRIGYGRMDHDRMGHGRTGHGHGYGHGACRSTR